MVIGWLRSRETRVPRTTSAPYMTKIRGVAQDYVGAHMWFNLATAQRHELARENRDIIAARMTPADVSQGPVTLAREWLAKQYIPERR